MFSHIRAGKVAHTGSHTRQLAVDQFRAPRSIRRKGSRPALERMRDDEPIDAQTAVQDDMQMMAETEMPHPL